LESDAISSNLDIAYEYCKYESLLELIGFKVRIEGIIGLYTRAYISLEQFKIK